MRPLHELVLVLALVPVVLVLLFVVLVLVLVPAQAVGPAVPVRLRGVVSRRPVRQRSSGVRLRPPLLL
jgi:hypothetical protein